MLPPGGFLNSVFYLGEHKKMLFVLNRKELNAFMQCNVSKEYTVFQRLKMSVCLILNLHRIHS